MESMASCRKMLIEILNYSGFISGDSVSYLQCSGQLGGVLFLAKSNENWSSRTSGTESKRFLGAIK